MCSGWQIRRIIIGAALVYLAVPLLLGQAAPDAQRVIDAIRNGRVYSVIDALATPGSLTFTATSGSQTARQT